MPRTLRSYGLREGEFSVVVEGLSDLLRDLRAIDKAIPREVRRELVKVAKPLAVRAGSLAPRGTRRLQKGRRQRLGGSLRPATRGDRVVIRSPLPYAKIVHWGGRRPADTRNREKWIAIAGRPFVAKALDGMQREIFDDLADAVDGVLARHGFN